jgi:glycosyltransferase involved in cell wall biosynthesis
MVLLIGNYPPDRQQSMQRFSTMMLEGLTAAGVAAELIRPEPLFGNFRFAGDFVAKWLAYIDKFVLFPSRLKKKLRAAPDVVHICDHSNAMYVQHVERTATVVTCHDLLAVRGALGEETDTPASAAGKFLQRWILRGLQRADVVACVSRRTCADAEQLVRHGDRPKLEVVPLGLSYPYRPIGREEAERRLASVEGFDPAVPFILHVGSNLRRKNREVVLKIFARVKREWPGRLVFAGDALSDSLRATAQQLGLESRITEVRAPSNEVLEALYNSATALVYPSRFEGFGWPVIEAQACGCPVLSSTAEPMPEVAGDGALFQAPDDDEGFAIDLLRLTSPEEHAIFSARALQNAKRFTTERMINEYCRLYRSLASL